MACVERLYPLSSLIHTRMHAHTLTESERERVRERGFPFALLTSSHAIQGREAGCVCVSKLMNSGAGLDDVSGM